MGWKGSICIVPLLRSWQIRYGFSMGTWRRTHGLGRVTAKECPILSSFLSVLGVSVSDVPVGNVVFLCVIRCEVKRLWWGGQGVVAVFFG